MLVNFGGCLVGCETDLWLKDEGREVTIVAIGYNSEKFLYDEIKFLHLDLIIIGDDNKSKI